MKTKKKRKKTAMQKFKDSIGKKKKTKKKKKKKTRKKVVTARYEDSADYKKKQRAALKLRKERRERARLVKEEREREQDFYTFFATEVSMSEDFRVKPPGGPAPPPRKYRVALKIPRKVLEKLVIDAYSLSRRGAAAIEMSVTITASITGTK